MSWGQPLARAWKWVGLGMAVGLLALGTLLLVWSQNLPDVAQLGGLKTLVGLGTTQPKPLPEPFTTARPDLPVALPDIAPFAVAAIISSEDRRFYQHPGFDLRALARSLYETLRGHRQGASTLTEQLVRSTLLAPDKTLERKFREMLLAYQVEQRYNKSEILAGYLNTVYWGANLSGIRSAALAYFGKPPADLTLAQGVYLAALLPAPNARFAHLKLARREMQVRLKVMVQDGLITPQQAKAAWLEPLQPRGWQAQYDRNGNLLQARLIEAQANVLGLGGNL
ncbi:MAG: transglycosylase domain-containing protein [Thermaceae bacterium]|nr:transglycosylase domain-containing protein [Thermaceae bacterium]